MWVPEPQAMRSRHVALNGVHDFMVMLLPAEGKQSLPREAKLLNTSWYA